MILNLSVWRERNRTPDRGGGRRRLARAQQSERRRRFLSRAQNNKKQPALPVVFCYVPGPRIELGTPSSSKDTWTISSPTICRSRALPAPLKQGGTLLRDSLYTFRVHNILCAWLGSGLFQNDFEVFPEFTRLFNLHCCRRPQRLFREALYQ